MFDDAGQRAALLQIVGRVGGEEGALRLLRARQFVHEQLCFQRGAILVGVATVERVLRVALAALRGVWCGQRSSGRELLLCCSKGTGRGQLCSSSRLDGCVVAQAGLLVDVDVQQRPRVLQRAA